MINQNSSVDNSNLEIEDDGFGEFTLPVYEKAEEFDKVVPAVYEEVEEDGFGECTLPVYEVVVEDSSAVPTVLEVVEEDGFGECTLPVYEAVVEDSSAVSVEVCDELQIPKSRKISELPEVINISFDTEYYQKNLKSGLLCISAYIPEFDEEIYIDSSEVNEKYNLVQDIVRKLGFNIAPVGRRKALKKINEVWRTFFPNGGNKELAELKSLEGLSGLILNNYGLNIEDVELYLTKRKEVQMKFKRYTVNLVSFYSFADLFKVFGLNEADCLWTEEARLQQFRTIKIMGTVRFSLFVDGVPCDFKINVFDCRYVFPPIPASLENQLKVYGVEISKISISEAIFTMYGDVVTEQWCKENMDVVKAKYPVIFKLYALRDAKATWMLLERLQVQFSQVGEILELDTKTMKLHETCGANIQEILTQLIYKEFGSSVEDNKEIDSIIAKGTAKALSKLRGNDFGVMPFTVTGGLLYTRTAKFSKITGRLLDLDESSCYATSLSSMKMYLGQPRVNTFFNNQPTLKERYAQIKEMNLPKDSWYLVVCGKLSKATNTIVFSDLKFKDGTLQFDYKSFSYDDFVNEDKNTTNLYDAGKITEPSSYSKILSKEIWMGKITEATMTAIQDLPETWIEEFMNLSVSVEVYYDPKLGCKTLEEYKVLVNKLPDDKFQVTDYASDNLGKKAEWVATKSNAYLIFDIGKHYQEIKKIRSEYKKAKNPIQEIFKLTLNSTYGIMASLVLKINNPVAANWITSCARAAAWRMTNSLNGFAPITDGTGFNLNTVPFGMTFKEVLEKYPNYLIEYTPEIENDFDESITFSKSTDFQAIYINHLKSFLGKSDWLVDMYGYELKDEKDAFKVEFFDFNTYYNTGAGNYIKEGDWGSKQKTRSYQSFPELTEWYKSVCSGEYTSHFIYVERELLQLSSGSEDAMRIIKDANDVHFRDKRVVKMSKELAKNIVKEGIIHPMGNAKNIVKLMKLISPSQLSYQNKEQFKTVDSFYQKMTSISKEILPKSWKKLDKKYLESFVGMDSKGTIYPVEMRDYDYAGFNFKSPVGLGFELICYGNRNYKTLVDVRSKIQSLLNENQTEKNGQFRIDNDFQWTNRILENLKKNKYLIYLLAATQIIKLNFEMDYITTLNNSTDQPTYRLLKTEDMTTLKLEKDKI
jgi:hypothetical protein